MATVQTPGAALQTPEAIIQTLQMALQGLKAGVQPSEVPDRTPEATIQALHHTIESTIHKLQATIHTLLPGVQRQEVTGTTISQYPQDHEEDFGDFTTDQLETAEIVHESEPWDNYNPKAVTRLFYPLRLGELLNGRYLVEHKLGHGGFSTVWMAHDIHENKDVALKILSLGGYDMNETRIQAEIQQHVQDKSHLVVTLDTFLLPRGEGDLFNTVHVLPLMGPHVSQSLLRKMPVVTRMSAAHQLLHALSALHEAGIVHRDVSSGNCMWGMSSLSGLDRMAKYQKFNRPLRTSIPYLQPALWKQGEFVQPAEIPIELRTNDFFLGDFGISTKLNDPTFQVQGGYPPVQYCSPERLHGELPSLACDMWSYMVVFSELYLGLPLFLGVRKGGIISDFRNILGPLPASWKGHFKLTRDLGSWYEEGDGSPLENTIKVMIAKRRPDVDEAERDLVDRIMRKVFVYSPEERLTAAQLPEDPDFKELMQKHDSEL